MATPAEMAKYEENSSKEDAALAVCREKILKHNLNMKLITAHFLLGEPKVIFFFTAEERVDSWDLVKDLVAVSDVCNIYDNTDLPVRFFKKRKDVYFYSPCESWQLEDIQRLTGIQHITKRSLNETNPYLNA